jgi:hypothetical protein
LHRGSGCHRILSMHRYMRVHRVALPDFEMPDFPPGKVGKVGRLPKPKKAAPVSITLGPDTC